MYSSKKTNHHRHQRTLQTDSSQRCLSFQVLHLSAHFGLRHQQDAAKPGGSVMINRGCLGDNLTLRRHHNTWRHDGRQVTGTESELFQALFWTGREWKHGGHVCLSEGGIKRFIQICGSLVPDEQAVCSQQRQLCTNYQGTVYNPDSENRVSSSTNKQWFPICGESLLILTCLSQ